MSLAELRPASKNSKPANGTNSLDKFAIVQEKLSTLFSNVERLESEKHGISKSKYTTLESENATLIKSIEDILNREMINAEEETKTIIFRYQKHLSGLKKKLNTTLQQIKKNLVEEESNHEETDDFLDPANEEESKLLQEMKVETYEDYIVERDQRIKGVHKDLGVIHRIVTDMNRMVIKESEDIELISSDVQRAETNTEKANTELSKANNSKSKSYKTMYKMIGLLVMSIFLVFYLIKRA